MRAELGKPIGKQSPMSGLDYLKKMLPQPKAAEPASSRPAVQPKETKEEARSEESG
jgi:hypothetical protein